MTADVHRVVAGPVLVQGLLEQLLAQASAVIGQPALPHVPPAGHIGRILLLLQLFPGT